MDSISPKLAPHPPSSPSKIPRRRPSSSSSSHSTPFGALPPSSPTKSSQIVASSSPRSNPWQTFTASTNLDDAAALQDRRRRERTRTRTRTRTQSTDLSIGEETERVGGKESNSPRRLPPLSIQIPHSHSQSHSQRTRSISASTQPKHPFNSLQSPPHSASSFIPRSRQPSQTTHAQSLRTPRSSHFPSTSSQAPPMSERPRVPSTSQFPRASRDRSNTGGHHSTLATPATYESFDFPLPTSTTPQEEREARLGWEKRRNQCCGLGKLWTPRWKKEGEGEGQDEGERRWLLDRQAEGEVEGVKDENGTKGKWEYVWGEIVCYAKHMLPPILLFVVLVLVIALFVYKQAIRRIIDDRFPPATEEP
ncbi:uncharacterized protein JCM6883_002407 [Sporobolomyces salmoneus]|uniref:uncharacterized protein n=1 Tax=Sporobolomyces salmoneus TaxID=183962 RepID=UPI00317F88A4